MKLYFYLSALCAAGRDNIQFHHNEKASCDFTTMLNNQINDELYASQFYLQMSYKFKRQDQSRPNFSKMLAEMSVEETVHATIFADFQTERGANLEFMKIDVTRSAPETMLDVLDAAIQMEIGLSRKLVKILHAAENGCDEAVHCATETKDVLINDDCQAPHLSDLITSQFLPGQYKDIHRLRALRQSLSDMTEGVTTAERVHNELFFDKELL